LLFDQEIILIKEKNKTNNQNNLNKYQTWHKALKKTGT